MSRGKIKIEDLAWTGNSKQMYDGIMEALPPMYKAAIKKKFEVWINQNESTTITELNIKHTIEKYAPKQLAEKFMPIYDQLKSED